MPDRLSRIERHGLRKLGEIYFPGFSRLDHAASADALVATFPARERFQLRLLLSLAPLVPPSLIRLLFLCEDEYRSGALIRLLAPVHIQIKGLCSLIYFDAAANARGAPDD